VKFSAVYVLSSPFELKNPLEKAISYASLKVGVRLLPFWSNPSTIPMSCIFG
jgi:hypothetical protein